MAREIAEIPALADGLLAQSDVIAAIAKRINQANPRFAVLFFSMIDPRKMNPSLT